MSFERMYENTTIFGEQLCVGKYDIPSIAPQDVGEAEFVGFHDFAKHKDGSGKALHFYLDDYRFNRVWLHPRKYLHILKRFDFVLSPDFSMYTDYPFALQLYSHYEKHALAQYWQGQGIKVIPTICWSEEESFEFCFDGEPRNATVSVASTGCGMSKNVIAKFNEGYRRMIEALQPTKVLFFGNDILSPYADRSIIRFCESDREKEILRCRKEYRDRLQDSNHEVYLNEGEPPDAEQIEQKE